MASSASITEIETRTAASVMPSFWFGLILIVLFAIQMGMLPTSGASSWRHYFMRNIVLGDYAMPAPIGAAFYAPRIDVSGGTRAIVDETLPGKVVTAIEDVMPVQTTRSTVLPYAFAWPAGVMHNGAVNTGCTEITSPWGDAALEEDE